MKHTPAPWGKPHFNGYYVDLHLDGSSRGGYENNVMIFSNKSHNFNVSPQAQAEANAKLIAAAPELLEALVFLVDDIQWQENSPSLKMVKKAIKKATS